ncbi:hypothetical protein L1887_49514 [Cichorium endivia]|nr:hypothetical protein L1887_49514 [Cichorium endivia]
MLKVRIVVMEQRGPRGEGYSDVQGGAAQRCEECGCKFSLVGEKVVGGAKRDVLGVLGYGWMKMRKVREGGKAGVWYVHGFCASPRSSSLFEGSREVALRVN